MSNLVLEDVDLSKLSGGAKSLVRVGLQLGWSARNTRMLGVVLTSPTDRGQTITLPATTNINQNREKSWGKKLVRYGDPIKVAVFMNAMDEAERRSGKAIPEEELIESSFPEDSPLMGDGDTVPSEYHTDSDVPLDVPKVVSEHPWLANQSTNEKNSFVYPSETTIERKWSDGTVDYKCTRCDYEHPVARSVARHYARTKVGHPDVGKPKDTMRAEPYVPATGTKESRVARLAREIEEAWARVGDGVTAKALAEKMIESRDQRHEREDREAVPLTPEETLERIRRLVDDGSYLRRIEESRELEDRISALTSQVEVLRTVDQQKNDTILAQGERLEQFETWASLLPGAPSGSE